MSLEENIDWMDSIRARSEANPAFRQMPASHRAVIDQRLARMQSDPQPGSTIEALFRKLRDRRK
jgi:hypothetical protein